MSIKHDDVRREDIEVVLSTHLRTATNLVIIEKERKVIRVVRSKSHNY